MGDIFDAMVSFFQEDDWYFSQMGEEPILQMGFRGSNGSWVCYAQAKEERGVCLFYSICPVKAPEEKRPALAEYLTRANYGMLIGNFEMDWSDGEVRYKSSISIADEDLSAALIEPLVYANVFTMDRYLSGIMAVIYGDMSPAEAVAQIEAD